jgi:catechol 2,3-dioxygenase-like lactoylglutathione lyase family enzyme
MPLRRLDHVNLRTTRLKEMLEFYRDVLGMSTGPRPNFDFGGAWLYCGDAPVVHLVLVDVASEPSRELTLQHFAFAADELGPFLNRLEELGVPRRLGFLRDFELCQVNVHDPDGNHMHIDFPLHEAVQLGLYED